MRILLLLVNEQEENANERHEKCAFARGERAKRASLWGDEHTRDEMREMAKDIMATSTTKLTLFHPIRLARLVRFARPSLTSLGADKISQPSQPRRLARSRLRLRFKTSTMVVEACLEACGGG